MPILRQAVQIARSLPARRRGAKNFGWYYRTVARMEEEAARPPSPPFPEQTLHGRPRVRAFMDIKMGHEDDAATKRIVFELAVRFSVKSLAGASPARQETLLYEVWRGVRALAG